jgi:hypothetical protein
MQIKLLYALVLLLLHYSIIFPESPALPIRIVTIPELPIQTVTVKVYLSSHHVWPSPRDNYKNNRSDTCIYLNPTEGYSPHGDATLLDGNRAFWDSLFSNGKIIRNYKLSVACDLNEAEIIIKDARSRIFHIDYSACEFGDTIMIIREKGSYAISLGAMKDAYYSHIKRFFDMTLFLLIRYNKHGKGAVDSLFGGQSVGRTPPLNGAPGEKPVTYEDQYLGLTEAELISRQGAPTRKEKGKLIYARPLGKGMHSYRTEEEFIFKSGKVVKINLKRIPVGCIIKR